MLFVKKWKNPSKSSKTYFSWNCMRSRCLRPKDKYFHLYGGRGITICTRWIDDYDAFFDDMGERPDNHFLDRINSNGNYEPENCKWSTMTEQQRNRRNTRFIIYNLELIPLSQCAEEIGISTSALAARVARKVSEERIFIAKKLEQKQPTHGTNNMYSRLRCRCVECKKFNALKSKKARLSLKLKRSKNGT